MDIQSLSTQYFVKCLEEKDIPDIYTLCLGNPLFYRHCPPDVTIDSIKRDMAALPPGKTLDDKYYIGFYMEETLIAVMDLISGYPDPETAYIGFFMMNRDFQGKGVGTEIISDLCMNLKNMGFSKARLVYAKGNLQSERFWLKNQFMKTGVEVQKEGYVAVRLERELIPATTETCDISADGCKERLETVDIELQTIILECKDIPALLQFYTELLHWPIVFESESFVRIRSPKINIEIGFQYDPDYIPPVWPTQFSHQQMMAHLDFSVPTKKDLLKAANLAVKAGAVIADTQYGGDWITMIDPAGHPFCFVYWG